MKRLKRNKEEDREPIKGGAFAKNAEFDDVETGMANDSINENVAGLAPVLSSDEPSFDGNGVGVFFFKKSPTTSRDQPQRATPVSNMAAPPK